jgi:hypothetical protein
VTNDLENAPRTAAQVASVAHIYQGGGGWALVLSDLKPLLETRSPWAARSGMRSDTAEGLHSVETSAARTPLGWARILLRPCQPNASLRDLGMPLEEIRAVLITDDPRQVRRRLELHGERLLEGLIDRRHILAELEIHLADAALERSPIAIRSRPAAAQPAEAGGSSTDPSSVTVQKGLWATSHGWPSGSTNNPE